MNILIFQWKNVRIILIICKSFNYYERIRKELSIEINVTKGHTKRNFKQNLFRLWFFLFGEISWKLYQNVITFFLCRSVLLWNFERGQSSTQTRITNKDLYQKHAATEWRSLKMTRDNFLLISNSFDGLIQYGHLRAATVLKLLVITNPFLCFLYLRRPRI